MDNLEDAIVGSIEDATMPLDEPETDLGDSTPTEDLEASPEASNEATEAAQETSPEVPSPAKSEAEAEAKDKDADDFEKKYGITAQAASGRENRIPYSRVKKITEKAIRDAKTEWETSTTPKLTAYETKIKDYETRLTGVAAFENMLQNDPYTFLTRLSTLPQYKPFFDALATAQQAQTQPEQPATPPPPQTVEEMPAPDQDLSDGSKVYSLEGLKKLLDWQARQVEQRVTSQYETKLNELDNRYKPLYNDYEAHQRVQAVIPKIQQEINEARTWNGFNENEPEIVAALQADQRLSLEGAYRKVVLPKLAAQAQISKEREEQIRNEARQRALADLRKAPTSTSVAAGASRPNPQTGQTGARSLEAVIKDAIQALK